MCANCTVFYLVCLCLGVAGVHKLTRSFAVQDAESDVYTAAAVQAKLAANGLLAHNFTGGGLAFPAPRVDRALDGNTEHAWSPADQHDHAAQDTLVESGAHSTTALPAAAQQALSELRAGVCAAQAAWLESLSGAAQPRHDAQPSQNLLSRRRSHVHLAVMISTTCFADICVANWCLLSPCQTGRQI